MVYGERIIGKSVKVRYVPNAVMVIVLFYTTDQVFLIGKVMEQVDPESEDRPERDVNVQGRARYFFDTAIHLSGLSI